MVVGGATGQYFLSTIKMPKKDQKDADQHFIETLIQRISNLEGRIEEQSKQLTSVMEENARLKVEMEYLRKENEELKQENGR
jgi:regulator of replication initiation timing